MIDRDESTSRVAFPLSGSHAFSFFHIRSLRGSGCGTVIELVSRVLYNKAVNLESRQLPAYLDVSSALLAAAPPSPCEILNATRRGVEHAVRKRTDGDRRREGGAEATAREWSRTKEDNELGA